MYQAHIICLDDRALPPHAQDFFAKQKGKWSVARLSSGHSAFASMPDDVALLIDDAVSRSLAAEEMDSKLGLDFAQSF
jgi:hypothetical protein